MAPDLNAISTEKWDYSKPGSAGYDIPNITYDDPKNRPMKVLSIGAGLSGIMNAYHIQKHCQNVEHVICKSMPKTSLISLVADPLQMTRMPIWVVPGSRIAIQEQLATFQVMHTP